MDTVVEIALRNAVLATLLAIIAWGVGKTLRRPALTHFLWVLVLLRLMVPPFWNVAIPKPAWTDAPATAEVTSSIEITPIAEEPATIPAAESAIVMAANPALPVDNSSNTVPTDSTGAAETQKYDARISAPEILAANAVVAEPAKAEPKLSTQRAWLAIGRSAIAAWPWKTAIAVVWLVGSAIVLGIGVIRIVRFSGALRQASAAPLESQQQLRELAQRMGMNRFPAASLVHGRISPLLWGMFGRAQLVLPAELWQKLDAGQRAALLVHELAHYARGDHWVRALEWLTSVVFWWHPVLWLARANLREAEEQCCDAWVIWTLPERRRDYATAIVDTLDFLADSRPVLPALASGVGTVRHLRRRLTMILRGNTPRRLPRLAMLGLLGLGLAVLALGTTWAQEPPRGGGSAPKSTPPAEPGDRRQPSADEREKLQAELQRARMAAEEARANLEQAMRRLQELERRLGERGRGDNRGAGGPMMPPGGAGEAPRGPWGPGPGGGGFPGQPGQPGQQPGRPAGGLPGQPGEHLGAPPGALPGQPGQPPGGMMPGGGMPGMGSTRGGFGGSTPYPPQNIEQRLANLERAVQDLTKVLQEMQRGMPRGPGGAGPTAPGRPGGGPPGEPGRGDDRPSGPVREAPPPPERGQGPERE
ncbi:MAG TPA: M56 family metallopeptidase [Gemmataceae bacterium]|jgi:beta-lactamase regulating signal transducer with metallopeptidase domain|nr:M56 family metallopeptidase [Gemmataceae bacterium]